MIKTSSTNIKETTSSITGQASSAATKQPQKELYIVDVSSMFFRAFYAIRPLTSTKGVPVNAVYGFISMIVKLMKEKKPDHIVFCYDRKEPSFRKNMYEAYKANRTEMPEDLQVQMPYLKQVASLFGITDLEVENYEADDLIGTIAKQASEENYNVYIVSGDKDFSQIVSDKVFIYDTMKEIVYDPQLVKEKHGVTPEQFIDFQAITGDSVDNIPGVAGIGPKGAVKLLTQFGTLENIYENIDQVESKSVKEKLINSKDNAFLSKKLARIVTDVKLPTTLKDYELRPFQKEQMREFFQELNFKSFEKSILGEGDSSPDSNMISKVSAATSVSADKIALNKTADNSVKVKSHNKVYYKNWDTQQIQENLKNSQNLFFFLYGNFLVLIHKQDLTSFEVSATHHQDHGLFFKDYRWSGFDLKQIWKELKINPDEVSNHNVDWDLMLAAYVLKATDSSSLVKLAKSFLNVDIEAPKKTEQEGFEVPQSAILVFAEAILQLDSQVRSELAEKEMEFIYQKLERPIAPILYKMEQKGITLDLKLLKDFSEQLSKELSYQEEKIHSLAGEKFNIASPKQLGVVLFEKLGLEVIKKTKTGYSTDNEVLEKLDHPIAKEVVIYREVAKLKSTYVDSLPLLADSAHRVHTTFNQALTATGRLSSTDPNLQNIPIKTEKGQIVRKAFIAGPGKKLLSIDYSQIELRVLAHISEDPGLIKAFQEDLDIHTATASEIFTVSLKEVSKDQRRIAKAVNFGIAYGQGVYGLAEALSIPRKEASEIIERYFQKFKGIREYIETTIQKAHEDKYVETLFGRRRYIPELDSKNVMIKKFGERAAINAPIQGTASDLVKMAMIELAPDLKIDLLLQVHDELIFEGHIDLIETQKDWIKKTMENVAKLKVPLKVNASIGDNWDEAH